MPHRQTDQSQDIQTSPVQQAESTTYNPLANEFDLPPHESIDSSPDSPANALHANPSAANARTDNVSSPAPPTTTSDTASGLQFQAYAEIGTDDEPIVDPFDTISDVIASNQGKTTAINGELEGPKPAMGDDISQTGSPITLPPPNPPVRLLHRLLRMTFSQESLLRFCIMLDLPIANTSPQTRKTIGLVGLITLGNAIIVLLIYALTS